MSATNSTAGPLQTEHWHFAHVNNKWTRRALAAAELGVPSSVNDGTYKTKAIFDVAEIVGDGTLPISSAQSQIFGSKEERTKAPEIGIKVQASSAQYIDHRRNR
jgi:sodium-independent sulfate anion transporter 11